MTKQVQRRRGTATQHTSFTGAEGELSVNTTNKSVHVHDGSTAGGVELARKDGANVAFTSGTIDGATIGGSTAAAGTFTSLTATGTTTLATTNVTGTITANDLTLGDTNPTITLNDTDGTDNYTAILQAGNSVYYTARNGTGFGGHVFRGYNGTNTYPRFGITTLGDTLFYNDTGVEGMRWDASAERLGIGTSSPSTTLEAYGGATDTIISVKTNTAGQSTFDGASAGVQLIAGNMNTTSKYTPSLQFGSYDSEFTTDTPRMGASIVGRARQTYSTDTGAAMALDFFTTTVNAGAGQQAVHAMTIDHDGLVGIGTETPSQALDVVGNIEVSGGIYIGGTAAGNLLDDYEEGTWSPTYEAVTDFTSVTYDSRTFGQYLKIGNMVYVVGRIVTDALSGGSGAVSLRLPFQPNLSYQHISIGYKYNFAGDYPAHIFSSASGFNAPIYFGTTFNGPTASTLQVTDMNTGANANDIMFSGYYTTNS